ncbi:MAG: 3-hydroxyacyl-CoA dehydrogenase NAD-binding domain-containing protein [Gammaproteobacteria bacterium]|nr:3-hydroxyacyl-CoA dehydrogenase NAD-binding domain-containing protein [Gammaproteobacteria bacterium]
MEKAKPVAVLGTGVIGASWAALFLAAGLKVRAYDPAENAEESVRRCVENAWPAMTRLGLAGKGDPGGIEWFDKPEDAVAGAGFVQESVPERIAAKHSLFAEIEDALDADTVVASSASGLMVSEMQKGWRDPSRFLLGHPFNPPHLIPLVELLANDATADGVLEAAEVFYHSVGKVTIRVKREVPAHVANRLQAALWQEAIHLVRSGVASVEDVDKAVWAGPGLRWAAMGPHMLFHLGAGAGGMTEFCNRYAPSFHRWWDDLGRVRLDESAASDLARGVAAEVEGRDVAQASAMRDELIVAMLAATAPIRGVK